MYLESASENGLPVALHIDDNPAFRVGFVESFVELPDVSFAVVGELALGVSMVDDHSEARALAGGGPFEHFKIAVGVARSEDGAAADVMVNADGFTALLLIRNCFFNPSAPAPPEARG